MEERIAAPSKTKRIIEENSFYLKKSFGQNFLIDENVVWNIVKAAKLGPEDTVIEIGPGIGSLTQALAESAKRVIAVEIDKKLIPVLEKNLSGYKNIEVINKDILKTDMNALMKEKGESNVKVVANLPYYITTPVIMHLLEKSEGINLITVMVQKEVAERMTARPGEKEYGALTVAVSYFSKAEINFNIGPNCFIPRPKVESSVISLEVFDKPRIPVVNRELFFKVVKSAFGQRRKTLVNSLFNQGGFSLTKEELAEIVTGMGFDARVRGEELSPENFAAVSEKILNYQNYRKI